MTAAVPADALWGFKFVDSNLTTPDHKGARFRYTPGAWSSANPGRQGFSTDSPCPTFPGDGLCVARTLHGAQSGGASIASTMLLVAYLPIDVLAESEDKIRVSRLYVAPEPLDPLLLLVSPGANLAGVNLQGANLRGANLQGAYLQGANLQGANLAGVNLQGANLRGANLSRADLQGAYLRGADLRGANLQGAYLRGADLQGANLQGAYLRGADLRGADLTEASLRGADVAGTNLTEANLTGADLTGAIEGLS
jgi:hypothetical protein